jgi:branched-chain amino acid transport system substrate-binding protein
MKLNITKFGVVAAAGALALSGLTVSASGAGAATKLPSYTIAYQGPLSGGVAQLGLNMKFAVQLAANQWNANPKRKFNLKVVLGDDQGDPTIAPTVATNISGNSKVIAVVGPAFSGATAASMPIYGPLHIAMVSPSATRVSLTVGTSSQPSTNSQNGNAFFRVVANDGVQGPADANYVVKKLNDKKILVVGDGSTYGQGLAAAFKTQAIADGATVTEIDEPATAGCSAGNTGVDSQYQSLSVPSGTQMVFYGGYYCDLAKLTDALRTSGYQGGIMSGDGSLDPHFMSDLSKLSDGAGVLLSCACSTVGGTAGAKFSTAFKKLAKFIPGTYSAEAYDAANLIIAAMNKVKKINRSSVLGAIHSINFKGLTKTIHFDSNGDVSGSAIYVSKVVVSNSTSGFSTFIQQIGLE